jgi:hypothetical protein
MQFASVTARQVRSQYRHEPRTLTYVTLDSANGGIICNLSHEGVALQVVAPLREEQRVRLRFELRFPRLRVDTFGQVVWSNSSGACGIRFIDLPITTRRQIDQWIFSKLLEAAAGNEFAYSDLSGDRESGAPVISIDRNESYRNENGEIEDASAPNATGENANGNPEHDGLILSASARPSIRLDSEVSLRRGAQLVRSHEPREEDLLESISNQDDALSKNPNTDQNEDWLSRPLAAGTIGWLIDGLVVIAALLLFTLIFISITHELPPWPLTLGAAFAAAVLIGGAYWTVFAVVGQPSLGARLARAASVHETGEELEKAIRIR